VRILCGNLTAGNISIDEFYAKMGDLIKQKQGQEASKYPGQTERSVNDSKPIKNGDFTETRYFSYTVISLQYRYGYITERFTGRFTWHRLRSVNECRLRTVLVRFFLKSSSHPLK
jgi:hypothetical protein